MSSNPYIVYKAIAPHGRVYIGITSRGLEKRKKEHIRGKKTIFSKALSKYDFNWVILESNLTLNDANRLEIYYISLYDSTNREKGYNLEAGGYSNNSCREYFKDPINRAKHSAIIKATQTLKRRQLQSKTMGGQPFICIETNDIFYCLKEAAEKFGTNDKNNIHRVLKGRRKAYKGFHFKYLSPDRRVDISQT